MKVLGIETSCDETGVAIYDTEQGLLADQLGSGGNHTSSSSNRRDLVYNVDNH